MGSYQDLVVIFRDYLISDPCPPITKTAEHAKLLRSFHEIYDNIEIFLYVKQFSEHLIESNSSPDIKIRACL